MSDHRREAGEEHIARPVPIRDAVSSITNNAPPNFSTGLKFATFCTVFVTLGLAVPLVLVRKRAAAVPGGVAVNGSLMSSRSMYRRPSGVSPSTLLRQQGSHSHHVPAPPIFKPSPPKKNTPTNQPTSPDAIIHVLKALGIATSITTASAGALILGFQYSMGVHTVSEFTPHIKDRLRKVLPEVLTSRMNPVDDPLDVIFSASHDRTSTEQAERRMQQAYTQGGIVKFGQQMWIEFEREWTQAQRDGEQLSSAGPRNSRAA